MPSTIKREQLHAGLHQILVGNVSFRCRDLLRPFDSSPNSDALDLSTIPANARVVLVPSARPSKLLTELAMQT